MAITHTAKISDDIWKDLAKMAGERHKKTGRCHKEHTVLIQILRKSIAAWKRRKVG